MQQTLHFVLACYDFSHSLALQVLLISLFLLILLDISLFAPFYLFRQLLWGKK